MKTMKAVIGEKRYKDYLFSKGDLINYSFRVTIAKGVGFHALTKELHKLAPYASAFEMSFVVRHAYEIVATEEPKVKDLIGLIFEIDEMLDGYSPSGLTASEIAVALIEGAIGKRLEYDPLETYLF